MGGGSKWIGGYLNGLGTSERGRVLGRHDLGKADVAMQGHRTDHLRYGSNGLAK